MREHTIIVNQEWLGPISYYEELNDCIEKLWGDVFRLFTNFEIVRDKHNFYINIEWDQLRNVVSHELKYSISISEYKKLSNKAKKEYDEQSSMDKKVSLKCKVKTPSKNLGTRIVSYYLELFFYELFLVLNLSGPGCCNFSKTNISSNTVRNRFNHQLNLSSNFFENAWDIYFNEKWPIVKCIPLNNSWNWYQSLNIGTKQLANTRIERVLFALMTISKNSIFDATNVIWLAHALEALYGNPQRNIKQLLVERIRMFLKPERKGIETKIRKFYKYRSCFVHGDLGTKNPINNSLFEFNNEISDYDCRLNSETDFSFAIVLSTIQKLILSNLYEIEF
ncbi:HEPN domain-containing protein [Desulfosporosinus sp. BG]|uniref:HEPN domain-containing protein n=1 Tax=Desulfosporosinus sp. BG TaxID=1633135 RepID=UPI00083A2736|nr:HEPN domain-containing protein [Desulfosporosinus sp. BG]ODA41063.1 hypothetical protein DSBG_2101 [Desulfosporosinus sp. BG]